MQALVVSHDVIHIPYPDNHSTKQEKQECTELDYHLYIGRHLPLPPQGLDPQASQCSGGSLHLDTGLFFRSLMMTKGGRMKITTKCKKYQDSVCTCKPANRCCRLLSCSSLLCCNWGRWGEGCWTWSWSFQTFVSSAFASTLQSDKA